MRESRESTARACRLRMDDGFNLRHSHSLHVQGRGGRFSGSLTPSPSRPSKRECRAMASMTAATSVAVPSFCGLRAEQAAVSTCSRVAMAPVSARPVAVRASVETVVSKVRNAALAGVAATLLLTGSADAATVKMGADGGALVFVPSSITIAKGETVDFVNNAGFPHNVVFDEDEVPAGIDAEALSSPDYINAPGQVFSVTFKEAGTYSYYCEPHQGAGMLGTVIVK